MAKYAVGKLDLKAIREELDLSQADLAMLLGVSSRTIQSCEQAWRKPSPALEKAALMLLMAHRNGNRFGQRACWTATNCPRELRKGCMAYLSRQGHLCWLMTGTQCKGLRLRTWADKVSLCQECDFFRRLLKGKIPTLR